MEMENQNNINNPHDTGYKYLLSSKKVFLQLLRSFVKEGWVNLIDENNLIKADKSYILQDFDRKEADLVYRLHFKDEEIIFYVLLEMQSTVDFQMPYRLLLYMVEIWRDILKDTARSEAERKCFRLPSIVPIVLYNGEPNWTAPLRYKETLSGYELFDSHALNFEYILIDVNRISKEELLKLSNLIGSVLLLDQKAETFRELLARLKLLTQTIGQLSAEEFSLFRSWVEHVLVRNVPQRSRQKIVEIIEKSTNKEVDTMVTNIERLLQEEFEKREKIGIEKGQQELIKNMLARGLTVDDIASYTGLPIDEVKRITEQSK